MPMTIEDIERGRKALDDALVPEPVGYILPEGGYVEIEKYPQLTMNDLYRMYGVPKSLIE